MPLSSSRRGALVVALTASLSHNAATAFAPKVIVAEWRGCLMTNVSHKPTASDLIHETFAWAGTDEAKAAAGCGLFCENWDYFSDRCVAPRANCVVYPNGEAYGYVLSSSVAHPALYPSGTPIEAGKYVVIVGAASAVGTVVETPYDRRLADDGFDILNFGRGSGAPVLYLNDWSAIEPIFANAAAVVVNVMAIRSSENSFCTYEECTATQRMRAWEAADAATQEAMEAQSFNTSLAEHAELLRLIAESPLRRGPVPKRILLWHSICDPSRGCARPTDFPQWYTSAERVDRLKALDGWDLYLDANYALASDAKQFATVPIDKCDHYPGTDAAFFAGCARRNASVEATCPTSVLRNEAKVSEDACGLSCKYIRQNYYPIEKGHDICYAVLKPALETALAEYSS
eukprot:CAMPEP_0185702130 /NCGR_PEP_ID=MMETSP1164-20130828/11140_1 /TAXON_ID=1104430 /ORGANISM="Chrysoreinhardia sp, Strain CCMP2950" /LENGTH=401 /DNA_ID=CAMNT_0028369293 /DNA_START=98 /DNA_END=1303 /DNA_ORIENTATION=-